MRLVGPQRQSGGFFLRENLLPQPEFEPRTGGPVASRSTDYGISPLYENLKPFTKIGICKLFGIPEILHVHSTQVSIQILRISLLQTIL